MTLRHWAFTLALVGIGWDLAFGEFGNAGQLSLAIEIAATLAKPACAG